MRSTTAYRLYDTHRVASVPDRPVTIPMPERPLASQPDRYLPDPGLVDAVNVALMLGQPLLVTGEPGTGKTKLASNVAWQLGLGDALRFDTKSNSNARDLFYIYNALGRFHAAHTGSGSQDNRDYITYHALGMAILLTRNPDEVSDIARIADHSPQQSVVLIDEIDKAPRDFPNDILNELEDLYFRIPELGNVEVRANPAFRPVVIITSNSEKNLPDAFLRRCVYYHIDFPDRQRLEDIVVSHLADRLQSHDQMLAESLELFMLLRSQTAGLRKKPATAELLSWISAMCTLRANGDAGKATCADLAPHTLGVLAKTPEDREAASAVLRGWLESRKAGRPG